ncbi:cytochrome P450 [Streptomyces sp. NPDC018833]|uniref:cytochrome P450 n=1 Tax=Streptomyces sp. NPDC018833 TaxID=3365053 RepID=UPI0037AE8183
MHRRHRRVIQPMFHPQRITMYAQAMSTNATALADSWTPGQEIEVEQAMAQYAIETLATTLFSTDIGEPAVVAIRENLPVVLKNLLIRAASPKFPDRFPIKPNRDFDAAAATLRSVIDDVVARTRRSGDTGHNDLLSVLLAAQDSETGESLSDTEVRDELSTILFAGAETTAPRSRGPSTNSPSTPRPRRGWWRRSRTWWATGPWPSRTCPGWRRSAASSTR